MHPAPMHPRYLVSGNSVRSIVARGVPHAESARAPVEIEQSSNAAGTAAVT